MKRNKFNVLIVDTETCMKNEHSHLIYDIGWTVGNILDPSEEPKSRRFIVANTLLKGEHWLHSQKLNKVHESLADAPEGMRTEYKFDSRYNELGEELIGEIALGNVSEKFKTWRQILEILTEDLKMVDCVGAYNFPFDLKAIQTTTKRFYNTSFANVYKLPHFCLMQMCANSLINRWYFHKIDNLPEDEKIHFLSKSGKNLGYSAEIMAKHIQEDLGYIEMHTAEEDSKIEYEIMRYFMKTNQRQNKFFDLYLDNVKPVSWQSIRKRLTAKDKESKQLDLLEVKENG